MLLAGLEVPDRLVLELAHCLRAEGLLETAETLEDAYDGEQRDRRARRSPTGNPSCARSTTAPMASRNSEASCSSSANGD